MITYKNITDVEVLNEMPEGVTALVNDGGELKQISLDLCIPKEEVEPDVWVTFKNIDGNFTCNLTHDEFIQKLRNKQIIGGNYTVYDDIYYYNYSLLGASDNYHSAGDGLYLHIIFSGEYGSPIALWWYDNNRIELGRMAE